MAKKDYKAFIVEGEAREPLIVENISKVFFTHGNFKIITLPAGENIYMLCVRNLACLFFLSCQSRMD
ncbi:MAG: hypothetical protein ACI4HI_08175 [Lachnospiraceae bacterium]